jgi:hypothetical protein
VSSFKRFLFVATLAFSSILLAVLAWLWPRDRIVLATLAGSAVPALLLDGSSGGCVDDRVGRGTTWRISNFVNDTACPSEVAVFAPENAMNLMTPIESWTAESDVLTIPQSGLLTVPLTVWTLSGLPADATVNASRADQIYNQMQAGVRFSLDTHDHHTQSVIASAGCENLAPLTTSFPPVAGRLNVYYLPQVTRTETIGTSTTTYTVSGRWCEADPNIVLIGAFYTETLAHELGHAFSLGHTDTTSLPTSNLMYSQAIPRDTLTNGQAFRINVNDTSALNVNGVRPGATRSCPDATTSARCPALTLDIQPK